MTPEEIETEIKDLKAKIEVVETQIQQAIADKDVVRRDQLVAKELEMRRELTELRKQQTGK